MLDVGWTEILVIAIVLIVVVGPKDLPHMLRQFGRTTAKMRAMAGDFRKQFDEALKEAELDDVRDLANQARGLDPRQTIRKHLNPIEKAGQDIKAGLDAAMKPKADSSAEAKPKADSSSEAASTAVHAAEPAKTGAVGKPKATNGAGKSRKAAPKKRATAKGADAKAAATRTKTAKSSNGNGSGKAKAGAVAPAKRAVKSPVAKPKAASATARKTRSASAAGKKPDKPGSAT